MKTVCIIVVVIFLAWVTINYLKLIWINYCAKKYFAEFDKIVQDKLLKIADNSLNKEHIEWYLETDDPNRKIALIKSICSNFTTEEYKNFIKEIEPTISKYNKFARKLKKLTDVFPTSFIARLKEIKSHNECLFS